MICKDRNGNILPENTSQNKALTFLYKTLPGRALLSLLIQPQISLTAGKFLDSSLSRFLVAPFIKKNNIDLSDYQKKAFTSFNDFFTRKICPQMRPIDFCSKNLIAPCDSRLSAYPINEDSIFLIKDTPYTMASLTRSRKLAEYYKNGTLLLFRLTVNDYHRYCYIANGLKTKNQRIRGVFHTVNPLANDLFPIYKENTREYCLLQTKEFGTVLTMEVGALLVGRILNYHGAKEVHRGEEKGRFEFGGSTIIVCIPKNRASIDADILENTAHGIETAVKLGEKIGVAQ